MQALHTPIFSPSRSVVTSETEVLSSCTTTTAGRVVVRLGEVEHRLPLVGRRHRADAHLPAVVPATGGDDVPGRRLPGDVHAEPVGDLGRHVDVEAHVVAGLLVQRRLRRIGGVGRHGERAAVADLGQQGAVLGVGAHAVVGRLVDRPAVVVAPSARGERQREHADQGHQDAASPHVILQESRGVRLDAGSHAAARQSRLSAARYQGVAVGQSVCPESRSGPPWAG